MFVFLQSTQNWSVRLFRIEDNWRCPVDLTWFYDFQRLNLDDFTLLGLRHFDSSSKWRIMNWSRIFWRWLDPIPGRISSSQVAIWHRIKFRWHVYKFGVILCKIIQYSYLFLRINFWYVFGVFHVLVLLYLRLIILWKVLLPGVDSDFVSYKFGHRSLNCSSSFLSKLSSAFP